MQRIKDGFNEVERVIAGVVAVVQAHRMIAAGLIIAVQSPVAGDDVQTAIPVNVPRRHPAPQARVTVQTQFLGDFMQVTVLILEHADRPPFARQYQVGITLPIQVAPDRAADQPHLLQHTAVFLIQHQLAFDIAVNPRIRRFGISSRVHPPAHEQAQRSHPHRYPPRPGVPCWRWLWAGLVPGVSEHN